jgi:NAD(P)-dependent dehydrogenase (short-subunit alcohol dehydrogenase family)
MTHYEEMRCDVANLSGKVAIVAGASRGAGKGIALALGAAGATVYVAARTTAQGPGPADGAPGTVEETADEITRRGGRGIPVAVDCTNPCQVASLYERVEKENDRLDLLANAVWGAADAHQAGGDWMASWGKPFWEQPVASWQHMMGAGPYAYFLMSAHAARLMARTNRGLIVGVTDGYFESPGGESSDAIGGGPLVWTLSHLCINLLMKGMAGEAKKKKIAVVTVMPGFMRTERVVRTLTTEELKKQFGFDKSETTEYVGRAVAALAADSKVLSKSGKIHFVADLAREYGFTDTDGRQVPRFNPFG